MGISWWASFSGLYFYEIIWEVTTLHAHLCPTFIKFYSTFGREIFSLSMNPSRVPQKRSGCCFQAVMSPDSTGYISTFTSAPSDTSSWQCSIVRRLAERSVFARLWAHRYWISLEFQYETKHPCLKLHEHSDACSNKGLDVSFSLFEVDFLLWWQTTECILFISQSQSTGQKQQSI